MLLIAGLGNPGPKYERNRHNIGFMAADEIVRRHSFGPWRSRFQSMVSEGLIAGQKALVIKPMTYMNESGRAIGEALRFFKMEPPELIVIYDELDLAAGKIRVKLGGGNAGHNGLRSIDAHIGNGFWRVRVGIGHPGDKARVHGHVLSDFAKAEQPMVERVTDAIATHIPLLVEGDENGFMSRAAHDIFPPPPKPPRPEGGEAPDSAGG
jgi:PTH1 family peptidyl-tRNA hydrolase